jgi:hypothetical protein
VFLGPEYTREGQADITPGGTGFLVRHASCSYLITAKHVAEALQTGTAGVRLNARDGGFGIHPVAARRWFIHQDSSVDIAVLPFDPPDWADVSVYSTSHFATPFKMQTKNFGPGDLAYIIGLFRLMYGRNRNLPVVHTGHIALVPGEERIPVEDRRTRRTILVYGYLIEAQALSGASGAPVFVRRTIKTMMPQFDSHENPVKIWVTGTAWLLGVWQASWDNLPGEILVADAKASENQKVPVGMGVVVPAQKILDVLDGSELIESDARRS